MYENLARKSAAASLSFIVLFLIWKITAYNFLHIFEITLAAFFIPLLLLAFGVGLGGAPAKEAWNSSATFLTLLIGLTPLVYLLSELLTFTERHLHFLRLTPLITWIEWLWIAYVIFLTLCFLQTVIEKPIFPSRLWNSLASDRPNDRFSVFRWASHALDSRDRLPYTTLVRDVALFCAIFVPFLLFISRPFIEFTQEMGALGAIGLGGGLWIVSCCAIFGALVVLPKDRAAPKLFLALYLFILLGTVTGCFFLTVTLLVGREPVSLYHYLKADMNGRLYRYDRDLGYAPIAHSEALQANSARPPIPGRFDRQGFRIALNEKLERVYRRPLLMTIGCSYTYGHQCYAEETFSYKLQDALHGISLNAGVCGYGLGQMVLLARHLIPTYRPDYVIFQVSPWLFDRSRQKFSANYLGALPTPYLSKPGEGNGQKTAELSIAPPVFRTTLFDLPMEDFKSSQKGLKDYVAFVRRVWLPFLLHDRLGMATYRLKEMFHAVPPLSQQKDSEIFGRMLEELEELCRRQKTRPILLFLGQSPTTDQKKSLKQHPDMVLVDAQAALDARAKKAGVSSKRLFGFWKKRGDQSLFMDSHPNPLAHSIIADQILKVIQAHAAMTRDSSKHPATYQIQYNTP